MPNTIYEFWLMIYQENQKQSPDGLNYSKIAMLTNFVENQCSVYFPIDKDQLVAFTNSTNSKLDNEIVVENSSIIYDEIEQSKLQTKLEKSVSSFAPNYNYFLIKNIDVCHKNGYSIRKLNIVYRNCGRSDQPTSECDRKYEFYVVHYWFIDWPDHRSPEHIDFLLDMSLDLLDISPGSNLPQRTNDEAHCRPSRLLQAESNSSTITENQKFTLKMTSTRENSPFYHQKMANDDSIGPFISKPLLTIHCSAGMFSFSFGFILTLA
jgi:protein tyrosine phosphatase